MKNQFSFCSALSLCFCLFTLVGCGDDPIRVVEDDSFDEMLEIYAKELVPTKIKVLDTDLLIDFPAEGEVNSYQYAEIVYPYILQIKILEGEDLAAAKDNAIKENDFKEITIDQADRLAVLNDNSEYTFWINKKLGDQAFTLTNKDRGWMPRTKEHLEWAIKMADTVRLDESAE